MGSSMWNGRLQASLGNAVFVAAVTGLGLSACEAHHGADAMHLPSRAPTDTISGERPDMDRPVPSPEDSFGGSDAGGQGPDGRPAKPPRWPPDESQHADDVGADVTGPAPAVDAAMPGPTGMDAGAPVTGLDAGVREPGTVTAPLDPAELAITSTPIAAQAGYYATAAPGQAGDFTGADLGWAFVHGDRIWVMFGDSWWIDPVNLLSQPDDALGQIALADFPDGASVDAFVRAHPAAAGEPAWRAAGPTMPVALRGGDGPGFAPVISERDGEPLPSGIGFTPVTGFSNGREDARAAVFALFFNYTPVECQSGRCPEGFECDPELSRDALIMFNPPCVVGSSASCRAGPGVCQDRGTTMYDPSSPIARTLSVVLRHNVGVTTSADPIHFKARAWETLRFSNATSRTVTDFDPARAFGQGNDYTTAQGDGLQRSGVFVWGRPAFGGIGVDGRDAQLYLLFVPMPQPDEHMEFDWQPQYFAGLDKDGRPRFSAREQDAKPLDLDAATAGEQPEEERDIVGQMGISWVPSLEHFVMFYGGEGVPMFGNPVFREDVDKVRHDPEGSLYVRFARHPWGPWTRPHPFVRPGDRRDDVPATGLYGPGGILAHNNCRGPDCAYDDPAYLLDIGNNNNGALYGASIVDVWTTARERETDLYWFVSTWNPYQVVLMKTTIALP